MVGTDITERVTRVEAWAQGHDKNCTERYVDIKDDTREIKAILANISSKLEAAITDFNDRIENEAAKARHAINNQAQIVDAKLANADKAVDVRLGPMRRATDALGFRVTSLTISFLVTLVFGLLGVVAFFLTKYIEAHP